MEPEAFARPEATEKLFSTNDLVIGSFACAALTAGSASAQSGLSRWFSSRALGRDNQGHSVDSLSGGCV